MIKETSWKPKSRKMMEGWMKSDEGLWFQAIEGFLWLTDRQADICESIVAFATANFMFEVNISSFLSYCHQLKWGPDLHLPTIITVILITQLIMIMMLELPLLLPWQLNWLHPRPHDLKSRNQLPCLSLVIWTSSQFLLIISIIGGQSYLITRTLRLQIPDIILSIQITRIQSLTLSEIWKWIHPTAMVTRCMIRLITKRLQM